MQANMHEAKSKLSQLVDIALSGEEVIIAKSGKPVVQLIPCAPQEERIFGQFKNEFEMTDDFDSPDTNDEISMLFGS